MPKRPAKAALLGTGWLCSEAIFDCHGDDPELVNALRAACIPTTVTGWREIVDPPGYHPTWRAYGTSADGRRCYVEVYDGTTMLADTDLDHDTEDQGA